MLFIIHTEHTDKNSFKQETCIQAVPVTASVREPQSSKMTLQSSGPPMASIPTSSQPFLHLP